MADLLLIVTISERRVAFMSDTVHSVVELDEITPVPLAPDFVVGLFALRSHTLTVIDTRTALKLDIPDGATDERAPVFEIDGHAYALRVDQVIDVSAAMTQVSKPDASLGRGWQNIALGIVETPMGPAILADPAAIIAWAQK